MVRIILLVLSLPLGAFCYAADGIPSGFEWQTFDEPAGRFMVPVDWQVARSKGKLLGSLAVYEPTDRRHVDVTDNERPQFTVNPVSNLSRIRSQSVSDAITDIVETLKTDPVNQIESVETVRFGRFRGMTIRFDGRFDGKVMRFQRHYLADDTADMLLIMSFRALISDWARTWPFAKIMMTRFELDSDIRKAKIDK